MDLRGQLIEVTAPASANARTCSTAARDYAKITEMAAAGGDAVIFTELRTFSRVGRNNAIVEIGSKHHPFNSSCPTWTEPRGKRSSPSWSAYVGADDDHPGRSYAYVRRPLKLFREEPELVVTSALQITDSPGE